MDRTEATALIRSSSRKRRCRALWGPRTAIPLIAVLSLAVSCSADGVSDVTGRTTTTLLTGPPPAEQATANFQPRFVAGRCVDGVPHDSRIRCGWLIARADRTTATGATVRLPVAIIRGGAAVTTTSPVDPVVYLAGGPGTSGLAGIEGFLDQHYAGPRDVVVLDQRGTGAALPDLNCPEVERAVKATFATNDPALTEQRVVANGFASCRARLVAGGVHLADFRTENSADDVEDLRTALGYREIDLYGASYGTALALTVMRRHPTGIRSATLDAVYPTTIANGPAEVAANARRAIGALEAGCAAAPSCVAKAPNLAAAIKRVIARFDAAPHVGNLTDPATGDPIPVLLTGADIVAGLVDAMYVPSAISAVPAAITALASGDQSSIDGVAAQGLTALTSLAEGMSASVECADRARNPTAGGLDAVVRADPAFGTLGLIADLTGICAAWDVPPASVAFSTPLRSAIPTLLLSGAYDPVTPPVNAQIASRALTRATSVVFPAGGHGAVFASDCAVQIFQAFLSRPDRSPDSTCAAHPTSPWAR